MAGNDILRALDKAKAQTYHFKAIIIAGMGFFTDAFDLFVISVLTKLLGRIYYPKPDAVGTLPINVNSAVTGVALCGTLAGQLFFGWAGDKWGRKYVYGITLAVMVVSSIGQGLSLGSTPTKVMTTLCFFRFWLGFGIGGDYPLSATIMSEYSNTKTRGAFVASVFAMQGVGILFGGVFSLIIAAIFNHLYPRGSFADVGQESTPEQADLVWRIILMFGAVPAALTFYSRSKMPETARYTALVEKNLNQAAMDMEKILNKRFIFPEEGLKSPAQGSTNEFTLWSLQFAKRHGIELLGTCLAWFLLDLAFYSQNLFQNVIFTDIGWLRDPSKLSAIGEVYSNARAQVLVAMASTVPGYWFTVLLIDKIGRKPIQLIGFAMMGLFMFILALDLKGLRGHGIEDSTGSTHQLKYVGGNHTAFVVLFSLTFFFANFGPNATTFIIPSELFPARLRSTCCGIAAACGKAGAIVGNFGFLYASQERHHPKMGYPRGIGLKYTLLILAITNTVGFFSTFLVPETKGKSLEELSGENDDDLDGSELEHMDTPFTSNRSQHLIEPVQDDDQQSSAKAKS